MQMPRAYGSLRLVTNEMLSFEHRAQNQQGPCFVFENKTTCVKSKKNEWKLRALDFSLKWIYFHTELG